jgi:hypothetical protein
MAVVLRCGIGTFRTLNGPLSGEVHVSGGYSRAKGARKRGGRANSRSLEPGAGPDDGSGTTAGGSARTSDAPPAARETSGGSADGGGNETKRAPNKDEQYVPYREHTGRELQPIKALPGSPLEFVKEVNQEVQLVGVMRTLLTRDDAKVQERLILKCLDLAYRKESQTVEEERPRKISWNVPR